YIARQKRFSLTKRGDRTHEPSASRQAAHAERRSGLGGVTSVAPTAAHAGEPTISAIGGPAQVAVGGNGFSPWATIQLVVINPVLLASGQEQIVNTPETTYLNANPCGQIGAPPNGGCGGPLARVSVPDYVGHALVEVSQCGASCADPSHPQMGPVVQEV